MTKESFMSELAILLKDISEDEREAALDYYRGYFEDAGPEQEDVILRQLGSPARIAAMIKRDIQDASKSAEEGEFTENGYQSGTEATSQSMIAQDTQSTQNTDNTQSQGYQYYQPNGYSENEQNAHSSRCGKLLLIITLCILGFPVITGILGICTGFLGAMIGIVFGLTGATIGLFVGGVVCTVVGLTQVSNGFGILLIGIGILLIGISMLFLLLTIWLWGTAIPSFVRVVVGWLRSLFGRKEKKA